LQRIRVMLAEMPGLLHDIVRTTLESESDLELVSAETLQTRASLSDAIGDADVVILSADTPAPDHYESVLREHPALRLVAISNRGRHAFLYELRPHRQPLGELSPATLLQAIRTQAAPGLPAC
jgi:hypothetical protein